MSVHHAHAQVIRDNLTVASTVDDAFFWRLVEQMERHGRFDSVLLLPILHSLKVGPPCSATKLLIVDALA